MRSDLALGKLNLYRELKNKELLIMNFGVYKETMRVYLKKVPKIGERGTNLINFPIAFLNARLFAEELSTLNEKEAGYTFHLELYGAKFDQTTNRRIDGEKELMGKIGLARAKNSKDDYQR